MEVSISPGLLQNRDKFALYQKKNCNLVSLVRSAPSARLVPFLFLS